MRPAGGSESGTAAFGAASEATILRPPISSVRMARAVGLAVTDRDVDMNYTRVLSAARAPQSAWRRRPTALGDLLVAYLLGLMAGVTHAQSAPLQIGPKEIGGVVKSTLGPEAGVWV